jgi:hypothetical protein
METINRREFLMYAPKGAAVTETELMAYDRIAGLLLTTEGLVAELPEEEKAPKYPTPPGGDMY